nr:uncharacterized protein LOC119170225 isoform X1 [Rhipicephalus microplus]
MIGAPHVKVFVVLLALATRATCETEGIFEVIGGLPSVTAVYALPTDVAGDELECLHANLTEYNTDSGKAIYRWTWRDGMGNNKTADNYITRKHSSYIVTVKTSNDHGHPFLATLPFFVDNTCFVLASGNFGGQCILWVSDAFRQNVPEKCIEGYKRTCPTGTLLNNDACGNTP